MRLTRRIGTIFIFLLVLLPFGNVFAEDYHTPATQGIQLEHGSPFIINYALKKGDIVEVDKYSSNRFSYADLIVNGVRIDGSDSGRRIIKFTATDTMVANNEINIAVSEFNASDTITNYLYNVYVNEIEVFNADKYLALPDSDGDGIPDEEDEFPDDPTNTPEPPDETAPGEVTNLHTVDIGNGEYGIFYDLPNDEDLSGVNIYINGKLIVSNYVDDYYPYLLQPGDVIKVTTLDTSKNESNGMSITFKLDSDGDGIPDEEDEFPHDSDNDGVTDDEEPKEVKNLKIEISKGRVDLSWTLPSSNFDKAIIYRKQLGTTSTASIFSLFSPLKVSAAEDYTPLFETNGTTFSDLTIQPETEYEYKITSMYNGIESNGVTINATVPKPPLIDLSDTELPFGAKELIHSGSGLLILIGGFILLALAFIFVPKLIRLIDVSLGGVKYQGDTARERISNYYSRDVVKEDKKILREMKRERRESRRD